MANENGKDSFPVRGQSEIFLDALMACDQLAILFVDSDHRVTGFNQYAAMAGERLIGMELAIGDDFRDYVKDEKGREHYKRACAGEAFTYEWETQISETEFATNVVRFQPMFDSAGVQVGVCLTAMDVTKSQVLMLAEAANRRRLLDLVEGTCDILRVEDSEGLIKFISPAVSKVLGYQPQELIGRRWVEFVHPEDRGALDYSDPDAHCSLEPFRIQQRVRKATGEYAHIECLCAPLTVAGEDSDFVISSREVSERVLAESDLRSARDHALEMAQLKSEFLANVSHEIRTPMNAVIGMSELLLDTQLNEEQRHFTNIVRDSAESLLKLINDILDFSKAEAGKLQLVNTQLDLRDVAEEVFDLLADGADRKGVELAYWADLEFPSAVVADREKLKRILTNLIGNAVKFTENGQVAVRLRTRSVDGQALHAVVEVTDTGIGIPFEAQSGLFRAFIQVDGSATRRFGGTGLGLAICKQLVQLMGGKIGVESTPGKGSKFWFTFPLTAPVAAPAPPEPLMAKVVCVTASTSMGLATSRLLWEAGFHNVSTCLLDQVPPEVLEAACVLAEVGSDGVLPSAAIEAMKLGVPVIGLAPFPGVRGACPAELVVRKPLKRRELVNAVRSTLKMAPIKVEATLECGSDLEEAAQRLGHTYGESESSDLLDLLVNDVRSVIEAASDRLRAGDHEELPSTAMRLVSACSSVGAVRLQAIASEFAKVSAEGDVSESLRSLARFSAAFEAAAKRLQERNLAA